MSFTSLELRTSALNFRRIWNFFIVMISPVLIARILWRTYLIFMALLALFIPVIWWFYPETSNLGLEEIDQIFLPTSMGGLAGNARVRFTPEMATERRASLNISKDEMAHLRDEKLHREHAADGNAAAPNAGGG